MHIISQTKFRQQVNHSNKSINQSNIF